MSAPLVAGPNPIAYDVKGAAAAVGLSVTPIYEAIRAFELESRYAKSKQLIGHAALLEWFENLPVDRPGS